MHNYSQLRSRAVGAVIDFSILLALDIAYILAFGTPNENGAQELHGKEMLPLMALWVLYFPVAEGLTGQTLGKKIMGTCVVRKSGNPITIWDAFVRRLFDSVDFFFFGLVGALVIKNTEMQQRVADLIAGTIVIDSRLIYCENCHEELLLDRAELASARFVCPVCGHANDLTKG